jgi:uncharacterized membrane protein YfcA
MDPYLMIALFAVAAAAGWVDSVVGGGGLLLIPALLLALPHTPAASALGTNKLAAISGTSTAAVTYGRRTKIDWRVAVLAGALAVVFAGLGAACASSVPTQYFRPAVIVLLLGVALLVTLRPGFGTIQSEREPSRRKRAATLGLTGVVIGFYDGILGPGTGTFLILAFAGLLGFAFVQSSAMAKIVNVGTNLGALVVFAVGHHVLWEIGLGMAVCNIVGGRVGALMAMRRGSGFVRVVLLVAVTVMVVKLGYDQFS